MMLCEKWIELLTQSPTSIMYVMLIYYCAIYIVSFVINKVIRVMNHPLLLCIPLIMGSLLLVSLWQYTGQVHVAWVYALMIMIAYFSVSLNTSASLLMDNRVQSDVKPKLLSVKDFTEGAVGTLAFLIGGIILVNMEGVKVFLLVGSLCYVSAYIFLYVLSKQKVLDVGKHVEEPLTEMKRAYVTPTLLFVLFFLAALFYSSLDPLHTFYVAGLNQGQEITFRLVGCLFFGGLLVSLLIPKILKHITINMIYILLFASLGLYYVLIMFFPPILVQCFFMVWIGAIDRLMATAMMIHLHHHYSGEKLGRYILFYHQGEGAGPFIAFVVVAVLTGVMQVQFHMLMMIFLVGITGLLIATWTIQHQYKKRISVPLLSDGEKKGRVST